MEFFDTACNMLRTAREAIADFTRGAVGDRLPFVGRSTALWLIDEANLARHERDDAIDDLATASGVIARHERAQKAADDTIERLRCKLADANTLAAARDAEIARLKSDAQFDRGEIERLKRMIAEVRTAILETTGA